ncbi:MAG: hypothetical protein M1815_001223 [Lichina confinis]|nr:MAG: hypothetical protein M1815_001223 [Lichina confinis]
MLNVKLQQTDHSVGTGEAKNAVGPQPDPSQEVVGKQSAERSRPPGFAPCSLGSFFPRLRLDSTAKQNSDCDTTTRPQDYKTNKDAVGVYRKKESPVVAN